MNTTYKVGIHGPESVIAGETLQDEFGKDYQVDFEYKTEAEAQAKADELGGDYTVIPVSHVDVTEG